MVESSGFLQDYTEERQTSPRELLGFLASIRNPSQRPSSDSAMGSLMKWLASDFSSLEPELTGVGARGWGVGERVERGHWGVVGSVR